MHTVDLLERSLQVAAQLGYKIRRESLGGTGGGACEVKGQKILFLDLTQGPADHLEQALDAIRRDPKRAGLVIDEALRQRLDS